AVGWHAPAGRAGARARRRDRRPLDGRAVLCARLPDPDPDAPRARRDARGAAAHRRVRDARHRGGGAARGPGGGARRPPGARPAGAGPAGGAAAAAGGTGRGRGGAGDPRGAGATMTQKNYAVRVAAVTVAVLAVLTLAHHRPWAVETAHARVDQLSV